MTCDYLRLAKALENKNPFDQSLGEKALKAKRQREKYRRQGYEACLHQIRAMGLVRAQETISETRHFLWSAYGLSTREITEFHMRITQDDYDGFFDWYHTTGTLIANRNGGLTKLGKIKDDEKVAQKITQHISDRMGSVLDKLK
jgi:hypothetical protein